MMGSIFVDESEIVARTTGSGRTRAAVRVAAATACQANARYALGYLLAVLNSRLYFQWLFHRGKRKGRMLELFQIPLSEIPIKRLGAEEQKEFIELTGYPRSQTKGRRRRH